MLIMIKLSDCYKTYKFINFIMIAKIINNTLRTKFKVNNLVLSNGFAIFKKNKSYTYNFLKDLYKLLINSIYLI